MFFRYIFIVSFFVSILFSSQVSANNFAAQSDTTQTSEFAAKAHALHDYVKSANKLVEYLDPSRIYDFPIGIKKDIAGQEYIIVIESIKLNSEGGFMTAYMSLEIPTNGKRVAFRGSNIKINSGGISGLGKLELAEDFPIKLSEQMLLTLKGDEGKTFVRFDCEGFKDMGIDAELELSRDLIIPENPDGTLNHNDRVRTQFEIQGMREWGDIVTKVTLPPFQVRGLNGFGFYVRDAVFDYSDYANISGVTFPKEYFNINPDAASPYWQGIFIKDVAVRLPKQFESTENTRTEFGASDLIIDEIGFTGKFRALNLLSLEKGKMGTWATSLDSIGISIQAGQLTSGGIKGRMLVPVFDENDPLGYTAIINTGGNYIFSANTTGNKNIPLWAAKAEIYPGSSIEVKITEENLFPKLILHGKLTVSAGKDTDVSLADIKFENLEVQTIKPYLKVGAFALGSEKAQQKMSGFPVTLNQVGFATRQDDVGILVDLSVNLVGDSDGGFAAQGNVTVWGEQKGSEAEQDWKFKSVELNALRIDVDAGAFELHGLINSYKEDPVYGKGFKGTISAKFTPGLLVDATAQFGNRNFRYWYVDALAVLSKGIPVAPAFGLYGFGGGAYYRMKQVNYDKAKSIPVSDSENPTDGTDIAGKTLSGITYVPDEGFGLGLKAKVIVGTLPSPKAFNGDAGFEIAFNSGGGINFISFSGKAFFMTDIDKRSDDAAVYASLLLEYEVPNKILYGNLEVYMNVAGGMVRGIGGNNRAGSAIIYFSPQDWFIHIGTPDNRVGIKMMHLFEANSYLMIGTNIPGMPAPPANVSDILGGDFNFMRDENALGKGGGFAFGAGMSISTGDLTFLVFYARLDAGAGFDIMMKNYGSGVRCAGRSEPLGVNGWYASGQAYAYIQGKVGIRVNLSFVKGDFEILSIGAAAILQTKLPNPFWMKGTVGGYYSILGGLVKGKCKFEATIGEQCQMEGMGSVVAGIRVIEEVSPETGSKDVSVFNAPQAAFNMEIGEVFELVDLDDTKKSFRIVLDYFKILDGGTEIPLTQKWNASKDVLAVQSIDVLPPHKQLKAIVKIHFEQNTNGNWEPVISSGKVVEEIKETSFTTGSAPTYIPLENVAFSYPLIDQYNFYKTEHGSGYIQLKQGQDYLFEATSNYFQKARFENESGKLDFDFSYNSSENKVNFNLPQGMVNDKVYKFTLVNIPNNATASIDQNVTRREENQSGDSTVLTKKNDIEGSLTLMQETSVYTAYFRTSKYSTLSEKLNALNISNGFSWPILDGVHELGVSVEGNELFDVFEIKGADGVRALIQYEASTDDRWLKSKVKPLIYNEYPIAGTMFINWRAVDSLGVPPVRAMYLRQDEDTKKLQEGDYTGTATVISSHYSQFIYNLPFYSYFDYTDLQTKSAAYLTTKYDKAAERLILNPFPTATSGTYTFKVKYVLPGTTIVTSEKLIKINNP